MTPLTSEQIRALRAADGASFRFELGDDTGTIRLSKDIERADGFGRDTRYVDIPARAIISNYGNSTCGDDDFSALDPATAGHWYLMSVRFSPPWATFASLVRPGDTLVQRWVIDNRNGLLGRAGLTMHELSVGIQRPAANGRVKCLDFMLDASVRNPYSPADEVTRKPIAVRMAAAA